MPLIMSDLCLIMGSFKTQPFLTARLLLFSLIQSSLLLEEVGLSPKGLNLEERDPQL